jgi:hypothetical protein
MTWRWRWWWGRTGGHDDAAAAREQEAKLRQAQREMTWLEEHGPALMDRLGVDQFAERVHAAMAIGWPPHRREQQ